MAQPDLNNQGAVDGEHIDAVPAPQRPDSSRRKNVLIVGGVSAVGLVACSLLGFAVWKNGGSDYVNNLMASQTPVSSDGTATVNAQVAAERSIQMTEAAIVTATSTSEPTASSTSEPTLVPTIKASSTLAETATIAPSATQRVISTVPGCAEITLEQAQSSAAVNQAIDQRDAMDTIPAGLVRTSPIEGQITCWMDQVGDAYRRGVLKPEDVTTYEKIAVIAGLKAADLKDKSPRTATYNLDNMGSVDEGLSDSDGLIELRTSAADLSQTLVRLADEAAEATRKLLGPDAKVLSAVAIRQQITADYNLENIWAPGVDLQTVDEVFEMCLTMRPGVDVSIRADQPYLTVKAEWIEEVANPSQESYSDGIIHLSNQDFFVVPARLVNEDQLVEIKKIAEEQDTKLTIAKTGEGMYLVLFVADFSNLHPNVQAVIEADDSENKGSGDQLVECGPEEIVVEVAPTKQSVQKPTGTPVGQNTPENPDTPVVPPSQESSATNTQFVQTASPTPHFTSTMTQIPTFTPNPTVTPAPSFTPQLPIDTATAIATAFSGTPTAVASWTPTAIPVESPIVSPVPPSPLPNASSTPSRP